MIRRRWAAAGTILCAAMLSAQAMVATAAVATDEEPTTPLSPYSKVMLNTLETTADGSPNAPYGAQIKNIIVHQPAGWRGLLDLADSGAVEPTWPEDRGRAGYLAKSDAIYQQQMAQVRGLSPDIATAALIVPDAEAVASGHQGCWEGVAPTANGCTGTWKTPTQLFAAFKRAANDQGVMVAPMFSINNYECRDGGCGDDDSFVLNKLQALLAWYRPQVDEGSLRNVAGKIVILTEGLPSDAQMSVAAELRLRDWMATQTDVLWIDNLVNNAAYNEFSEVTPNIIRSAATSDPTGDVQDALRAEFGDANFLYHFSARFAKSKAEAISVDAQIPEDVRLRWLNITPHSPAMYPVIISQFNEYAEYLLYEPTEFEGSSQYDYLRWRLSQQPDVTQAGGVQVSVTVSDERAMGTLALSLSGGSTELVGGANLGDRLRFEGALPQFTVADSRTDAQAAGGGWAVTGQMSALTSGAATIEADYTGWSGALKRPAEGVTVAAAPRTALDGGSGLARATTLLSATNDGRFGTRQVASTLRLDAPLDVPPGTYTGSLTVSLFPVD